MKKQSKVINAPVSGGMVRGRSVSFALAAIAVLVAGCAFGEANAQTFDGVDITVPGAQSSPWNTNALTLGITGTTSLSITGGGVVNTGVDEFTGTVAISTGVGSNTTITVDGAGSAWSAAGKMQVGTVGTATMTISNGGQVNSKTTTPDSVSFGINGLNSTVTVTGADSKLTATGGQIAVGDFGTGTLNVKNGATVTTNGGLTLGISGYNVGSPTASGTVLVDGATIFVSGHDRNNINSIRVGGVGTGSMTIVNGGSLIETDAGAYATIADLGGQTGSVLVDGANSKWVASAQIDVGGFGNGSLTITNGGAVSTSAAWGGIRVGVNAGSTGTLLVDNGTLTAPGGLQVGMNGTGTVMIRNGSTVTGGAGYIGGSTTGNLVTVTGAGTVWNSGYLSVGTNNGSEGTLKIENGAVVNTAAGYYDSAIGNAAGSTGSVFVTGTGSQLNGGTKSIHVGSSGTGLLEATAGGQVTMASIILGTTATGNGTIHVSGTNSKVTATNKMTVGNAGTGLLTVDNGGSVSAATMNVGLSAAGRGEVIIKDSGSSLNVGFGGMIIGYGSTGDSATGKVTISNGASATVAASTQIGLAAGNSGILTVQDANTKFTSGSLYLGNGAGSAEMTVRNGASATITGAAYILAADGKLTVTDSSTLTAGSITVGNNTGAVSGAGDNSLVVVNSGKVTAGSVAIGTTTASKQALVSVDGAGAQLNITNTLNIANLSNSTGKLTLTNGAAMTSGTSYIGYNSGGTGTLEVHSGSTWTAGATTVAFNGTGTLTIDGASKVTSTSAIIGQGVSIFSAAVPSNGTATVTGAGSKWTTGNLTVGQQGQGALTVSQQGEVVSNVSIIGQNSTSSQSNNPGTGVVEVKDAGSKWTNTGTLTVGDLGNGTLKVNTQGQVSSAGGWIGKSSLGAGYNGVGVATVSDAGSVWTDTGTLAIGGAGTGTLNVVNAGVVNGATGVVGQSAGGSGTVNVHDANSKWTNSGTLTVADAGAGTLNVSAQGKVSSAGGTIGKSATGVGTATVTGAGSNWTSGDMTVGAAGKGTLNINQQGTVNSGASVVGAAANTGNGVVAIDGANSIWANTGSLTVGQSGTGTVTLTNNAVVSNTTGTIGANAGSHGKVKVSTGSTWTNNGQLTVAGGSADADLTVDTAGKVTSTSASIGASSAGVGTATVTGLNSNWTSGDMTVGAAGKGTLNINQQGTVTSGNSVVGAAANTGNGTVNVQDANSIWSNSGNLTVADGGTGTVNITAGGKVTNTTGLVGKQANSSGAVVVDGASSLWQNSATLTVADNGAGNMTASHGGKVTNTDGFVGRSANGAGMVNIQDANSLWQNSGNLTVADAGSGRMNVTAGGKVENITGLVGKQFNSSGTVVVDGASSWWQNSATLTVADGGAGNMTVSHGGKVTNTDGFVGKSANGSGTVNVQDANSLWQNSGDLTVADAGSGIMNVRAGGKVENVTGVVGKQADTHGAVLVDGASSWWENSATLTVADNGAGNMTVSNGGKVTNTDGFVGKSANGSGTVNIQDANSIWSNSGNLTVADAGSGTMNVRAGGKVENVTGVVGKQADTHGAVVVDGASSLWQNSATLTVADNGAGDMTVSNGGKVTNTDGFVGKSANSTGTVNIQDDGSLWRNSGNLTVADAGTGTMNITASGKVENVTGIVGNQAGSHGTVLVDAPAWWANSATLTVAKDGAGAMTVEGGGLVTNTDGFVGKGANGDGAVTVTGAGSLWNNSGALTVADSGKGALTVTAGGEVRATDGLVANLSGSKGTVEITDAGQWNLTGDAQIGVAGDAQMRIASGGKLNNSGVATIGVDADSTAKVVVTGAGSKWTSTGAMTVGAQGSAELTLTDGGVANPAGGKIFVATDVGSTGSINIGSAAADAPLAPGSATANEIAFGAGDGRVVFNHSAEDYAFAPKMTGAGAVDVYAGATALTAANDYSGATTVYGGILRAGATNAFSRASSTDIRSEGTLELAGYNQTIDAVRNAGMIRANTATGTPGTLLNVHNYTGASGNLVLNTALGDETSATDKLAVSGSATGLTLLHINNVGGLGGYTKYDGILVIEAVNGGTVDANAFMLGSRVAAGAYEYSLVQGGHDGQPNWYLQNTLPGWEWPVNPVPAPNYRVEVPLATSIPPVAMEYGYAVLGTLHERVGEGFTPRQEPVFEERRVRGKDGQFKIVQVPVQQAATDREKWFGGAWARAFGDRGRRDNDNFAKNGPDYDYTFGGVQAGFDIYGNESATGSVDKAGVYVAVGQIAADVKGAYTGNAGSISTDAYTVGAYFTHKDMQGWYADAVIQNTWYNTDATSIYGQKLKPDGYGVMASLEGGYSFNIGSGWTIEPQAQIAWQHTSFGNVTDAYGHFQLGDDDSIRGRLGVRATKTWNMGSDSAPRLVTLWGRANIWHEFLGKTATTTTNLIGLDPVEIRSSLGGTWGEIGAGVSGQISDNATLFATGAYQRSLDGKGREGWNGRIGANVKW